jgi:hypothetical protein
MTEAEAKRGESQRPSTTDELRTTVDPASKDQPAEGGRDVVDDDLGGEEPLDESGASPGASAPRH